MLQSSDKYETRLILLHTPSQAVDMNNLTDTPMLKFNPNTLVDVRKKLNLHQKGVLYEMISNFEDWISKQNHFTKKSFDRHYLEVTIIHCKGSLERAKNSLDKLCTLKTSMPDYFSKHDAQNQLIDTSGTFLNAAMPKLLENNYRLHITKIVSTDFNSRIQLDFHRFCILMMEYGKLNDYTLGLTFLIDCRNINILKFVTKLDVLILRNSMGILIDGYGMSINAIHLLSTSKSIDLLVNILKQVISPKVANRIHVHETVESLYEHVPREVLPEEYGGAEKSLKQIYDDWVNCLSIDKNVASLRDICKADTDEKRRLATKYNENILGLPGSFRALTVD